MVTFMRTPILLATLLSLVVTTPVLARHARPLVIRPTAAFRVARLAIVDHGLLTPQQLACSLFVRGPKAVGEATEVVVLEKHGGRCPGDPRMPPVRRFDLYVDAISGSIQWDLFDPTILQTPPDPGVEPTPPSIVTSCGVCAQP